MKYILLILSITFLFAYNSSANSYFKSKDKDTNSINLCIDTNQINFDANDSIEFRSIVTKAIHDSLQNKPINEIIESIARHFIGIPYGSPKREASCPDKLLIGFDKFNCVTFVETVVAIARSIKSNKIKFCEFADELKTLRYRKGIPGKFHTRLHYFSDWIYDNEDRRILTDMCGKIDSVPWKKKINFMTTHKNKYRKLKDSCYFNKMNKIEKDLSNRKRFYLPKEKIDNYKSKIQTGDIIVMTVNTPGLDVSHTGLAVWENNDLYLLHASSQFHKVIISKTNLKEYLSGNKKLNGILVARLN